MSGYFVISLDFELMWGVRDKRTVSTYGDAVKNVHIVIPRLLQLAEQYGVRLTFCTIGFLFNRNKNQLLANIPSQVPSYTSNRLSPYGEYLSTLGSDEQTDPYHFGYSLIDKIRERQVHEIGTHTYSHYFALEPGQTKNQFEEDIKMACSVAAEYNLSMKSIVFPRNQVNTAYLDVLLKFGINCFRGTEASWLYKPRAGHAKSKTLSMVRAVRRILRLIDTYIPFSGNNCYGTHELPKIEGLWNLPSSRLLRAYNKKLRWLEPLKRNRIKNGMTHAAIYGKTYHLWWHPHNFGRNTEENFKLLEQIFEHYIWLNKKYAFRSVTMNEMVTMLNHKGE